MTTPRSLAWRESRRSKLIRACLPWWWAIVALTGIVIALTWSI